MKGRLCFHFVQIKYYLYVTNNATHGMELTTLVLGFA